MAKTIILYVEGKSDQLFFEGSKFKEFAAQHGFSIKSKNLKSKGNVISNFEKFLKLQKQDIYASVLVYDKDSSDFDVKRVENILKSYKKAFYHVAIQELEAWFMADHSELLKIDSAVKTSKDTQSETNPKRYLKTLFLKSGKGFKNEIGFAQHFSTRIDIKEARKHNKSLDRFLHND